MKAVGVWNDVHTICGKLGISRPNAPAVPHRASTTPPRPRAPDTSPPPSSPCSPHRVCPISPVFPAKLLVPSAPLQPSSASAIPGRRQAPALLRHQTQRALMQRFQNFNSGSFWFPLVPFGSLSRGGVGLIGSTYE